jgi:hypothetical protein
MDAPEKPLVTKTIPWGDARAGLQKTRIFADVDIAAVNGIGDVELQRVKAGAAVTESGDPVDSYWVVVKGEMRAEKAEKDGSPRRPCSQARRSFNSA